MSSKKIKILVVSFDIKLQRREIPAFRGAVIKAVGQENVLFHNHFENKFRYGYPLIQYKLLANNPSILFINQGYDEGLRLFEDTQWSFKINGNHINAGIKHLSFDYVNCGISKQLLSYRVQNWFALNRENYEKFITIERHAERKIFLERIMIGNLLSFAKGIKWSVDEKIIVSIKSVPRQRSFNFKDHKMVGFDMEFITNVILPDKIGLGKSVSRGFGIIRRVV